MPLNCTPESGKFWRRIVHTLNCVCLAKFVGSVVAEKANTVGHIEAAGRHPQPALPPVVLNNVRALNRWTARASRVMISRAPDIDIERRVTHCQCVLASFSAFLSSW